MHLRDVLGLPKPPQRDQRQRLLTQLLWNSVRVTLSLCLRQPSFDEARSHRIDVDSERTKFAREGLGDGDQSTLGRRVIELTRIAHERGN